MMTSHTCLLLGSAGEGVVKDELQSRLAPKPKSPDKPKVRKALAEALNDIVCLTDFCSKRNIEIAGTMYSQGVVTFTKAQMLDAMRKFFRQADKTRFWLMYSGHGEKSTGNWCCYDGFITFAEVMREWKGSGNMENPSKKLLIFCDSCYSGDWKEALKNSESITNVALQASCLPGNVAYDGVFTKVFISCVEGNGIVCSCTKGSTFCFVRHQIACQHVSWRRGMLYGEEDIRQSFGIRLINTGTWQDW